MECDDIVKIMVGTTTYPSKEDAEYAIDLLVRNNLAKCGQAEGPIQSHYIWECEKQVEMEWRVTFKFTIVNRENLEKELMANHPYDTPQWIVWVCEAETKYGSWVNSGSD